MGPRDKPGDDSIMVLQKPKRAGDSVSAVIPSAAMSSGTGWCSAKAAARRESAGEVWMP